MNVHTENPHVTTSNFGLRRTASKTVRKSTSYFGANELPRCIAVTLDWFTCSVDCLLPEPADDTPIIPLDNGHILRRKSSGTPVYKYSYEVILHGELVANIHTHGRTDKIAKPGTAKLEILNHVLYSSSFLSVLHEVMAACSVTSIRNTSEVHIAIDGANHVHRFLNEFEAQNKRRGAQLRNLGHYQHKKHVALKGKANWDSKRLDRKKGEYQNFKIGSNKKYITVYNKTSDMTARPKSYIKDMWDKAGIDQTGTVWRCELRMKSEAVKEIKNFDLTRLNDPNYLLQIFKTHCKNFFDFVLIENDENLSRARGIDLFDFEKLKVTLLEKIPRAIVQGAYKARMAIHNAYANIRLGAYSTEESVKAALQHITDNAYLYHVEEWYYRKKEEWDALYPSFQYGLS